MNPLRAWHDFYVIVGSSAGALIGLQFVVMTLVGEVAGEAGVQASSAFGTPTVMHFCAALLLAALLCAPSTLATAAVLWGLVGIAGLVYAALVLWRMRRQKAYRPELEDWLFHGFLPVAAYAVLLASALAAGNHSGAALGGTAAAALLLLFIGIHNAWDTATYHIFVSLPARRRAAKPSESEKL
ncbi:MAG TPA: hypothetical protein VN515_07735 [Terriglobales bacterium]|nr:hypothetical protein [Terriglobales bacterium]